MTLLSCIYILRLLSSSVAGLKKNVPKHILAPSAVACDNLHLCASAHHRRVSAFLCNREFLGISYYIKKTDILPQQDVWPSSWARRTRTFKCRSQNPVPCQFGDSPMSLDKKNYITGNQKRQALFLNFLNFFIYIYKIPNSTICRKIEDGETSLVFESNDPQLIMSGPFSLPSAGSGT